MGGAGSSTTASSTNYLGLAAKSTTESNVQTVLPVTMTFTHFFCFGPKPTSGTDAFTLMVNGVATTAVCTIPTNGTSVVNAAVNVTIAAGSLIDVKFVNGNTAGGATWGLAP
jgi:hypothetical protein